MLFLEILITSVEHVIGLGYVVKSQLEILWHRISLRMMYVYLCDGDRAKCSGLAL